MAEIKQVDPFRRRDQQTQTRQPTASHDLRERESRYRHALELIRDAVGLDSEAQRVIADAALGPKAES